jgi:hypothetical protein
VEERRREREREEREYVCGLEEWMNVSLWTIGTKEKERVCVLDVIPYFSSSVVSTA